MQSTYDIVVIWKGLRFEWIRQWLSLVCSGSEFPGGEVPAAAGLSGRPDAAYEQQGARQLHPGRPQHWQARRNQNRKIASTVPYIFI